MFKYTYKTRGFSIGCQPKDFIKFEKEGHNIDANIRMYKFNRLSMYKSVII